MYVLIRSSAQCSYYLNETHPWLSSNQVAIVSWMTVCSCMLGLCITWSSKQEQLQRIVKYRITLTLIECYAAAIGAIRGNQSRNYVHSENKSILGGMPALEGIKKSIQVKRFRVECPCLLHWKIGASNNNIIGTRFYHFLVGAFLKQNLIILCRNSQAGVGTQVKHGK